ncbi:helix-turn-helix transcriptional regulator [Eggerthellaceae bacterium 24-137]
MNREKLSRLIASEIDSRGTMAEFSRESGIPYHTVKHLCEGTRVTFDAVERVCSALGLRMSELLRSCEGPVAAPERRYPDHRTPRIPVYVDGRRYASVSDGARSIHVSRSTLWKALDRGDRAMRVPWGWVPIAYADGERRCRE